MSTITKLDPRIRVARTRRASAVRAIRDSARGLKEPEFSAVLALAVDLNDIRKNPALTGAQKTARFKTLMAHV